MSYHPASDEVHVTLEIPSGTPDRAERGRGTGRRVRDDARRRAAGCRRLRPGRPRAGARRDHPPAVRQADRRHGDGRGRRLLRPQGLCLRRPGRARKVLVRRRVRPRRHEVEDGYDTVEWAIAQDWCDGRVGFWGESYYGITSYAAAMSGHPAIACIAPGDIGVDRRAAWFRQGAFLLNTTGYWALAMDAQEYADVSGVDPYALPLTELPRTVGLEGALLPRARCPCGRPRLVGAPRARRPDRRYPCSGALLGRLVRRLHRAAAGRLRPADGGASAARRTST